MFRRSGYFSPCRSMTKEWPTAVYSILTKKICVKASVLSINYFLKPLRPLSPPEGFLFLPPRFFRSSRSAAIVRISLLLKSQDYLPFFFFPFFSYSFLGDKRLVFPGRFLVADGLFSFSLWIASFTFTFFHYWGANYYVCISDPFMASRFGLDYLIYSS